MAIRDRLPQPDVRQRAPKQQRSEPRTPGAPADLFSLRSTAGNHAVARMLASHRPLSRQRRAAAAPAPSPAARSEQQLAELTEDALRAIAMKETKDRPIESSMRTSAGVRASYASKVQATAQWSIAALLRLGDAALEGYGLTRSELTSANARMVVAGTVWDGVMATPATTTAAAFAADRAKQLALAGLALTDVERMFLFRDLQVDLDRRLETTAPQRRAALEAMAPRDVWQAATPKERATVKAATVTGITADKARQLAAVIARREAVAEVAAGAPARTLGIDSGTINAYRPVKGGKNWGEDRAAWQRVAVGREPAGGTGTVGARLEAAATDEGGLRLGRDEMSRLAREFVAARPAATDQQVCDHLAKLHNSGNPEYAIVRGHFARFRRERAPRAPAPGSRPAPGGAPAPASRLAPAAPAPTPAPASGPAPTVSGPTASIDDPERTTLSAEAAELADDTATAAESPVGDTAGPPEPETQTAAAAPEAEAQPAEDATTVAEVEAAAGLSEEEVLAMWDLQDQEDDIEGASATA